MDENYLVILAGGISSRMKKPISENVTIDKKLLNEANHKSKSMIGIGAESRPFLDYLLYNAKKCGYKEIVIVISEKDMSIREHYGLKDSGNNYFGLNISYAVQEIPPKGNKPLGTADALYQALLTRKDWEGKRFTVCNSDNLYSEQALKIMLDTDHLNAMIDYDRNSLEFDLERIEKFAVTKKNKNGFLVDIIEKPAKVIIDSIAKESGYIGVSMNLFRFSYDMIFPFLEIVPFHPLRNEKELTTAIKMMIDEYPDSLYTYYFSEHVPDLTNKKDILQVKKYLEEGFDDKNFFM